jgi:hypothetical protein
MKTKTFVRAFAISAKRGDYSWVCDECLQGRLEVNPGLRYIEADERTVAKLFFAQCEVCDTTLDGTPTAEAGR